MATNRKKEGDWIVTFELTMESHRRNDEGDFSTPPVDVLNKWREDFERLYNKPEYESEDIVYINLLENKTYLEENMDNPGYAPNVFINEDLLYTEVNHVIARLKRNKAVGIDVIPNELLKYDDVKTALVHLFNLFNTWYGAMVWCHSHG